MNNLNKSKKNGARYRVRTCRVSPRITSTYGAVGARACTNSARPGIGRCSLRLAFPVTGAQGSHSCHRKSDVAIPILARRTASRRSARVATACCTPPVKLKRPRGTTTTKDYFVVREWRCQQMINRRDLGRDPFAATRDPRRLAAFARIPQSTDYHSWTGAEAWRMPLAYRCPPAPRYTYARR